MAPSTACESTLFGPIQPRWYRIDGGDVAIPPGDDVAGGVETGAHAHQRHRPVLVVAEVLLARPGQLDRLAHRHRDADRLRT